MANILFIEGLVNSMEQATLRLEDAISNSRRDEANRLRAFIFDVYKKIDEELGGAAKRPINRIKKPRGRIKKIIRRQHVRRSKKKH